MPQWIATTAPGLEPIVARELTALGQDVVLEPGAVCFEADLEVGVALSLQARTPTRLLLTVAEGPAASYDELDALIRQTDWSSWLVRDHTVDVSVSFRGSNIRHKQALERRVGRSIRGVRKQLRTGRRKGVDQRLQVRVVDNHARLALDAGGDRLHRRGWRQDTGRAPLRENFAASLLIAAGWTGDEPLIDPFCGVGTLPIEATLLAAGRSPHLGRVFAWQGWPGLKPPPLPRPPRSPTRSVQTIVGIDKEPRAIVSAQANAARAAVAIDWRQADVRELEPIGSAGLVIANPPFGRRLGHEVSGVYDAFGHALRTRFAGWRALFLAPHRDLASLVHQRCERLTTFPLGGKRVGVYVVEL